VITALLYSKNRDRVDTIEIAPHNFKCGLMRKSSRRVIIKGRYFQMTLVNMLTHSYSIRADIYEGVCRIKALSPYYVWEAVSTKNSYSENGTAIKYDHSKPALNSNRACHSVLTQVSTCSACRVYAIQNELNQDILFLSFHNIYHHFRLKFVWDSFFPKFPLKISHICVFFNVA
jgi:hypothetical protein